MPHTISLYNAGLFLVNKSNWYHNIFGRCSLSRCISDIHLSACISKGPTGIRTQDLLFTRQALCQLSHGARCSTRVVKLVFCLTKCIHLDLLIRQNGEIAHSLEWSSLIITTCQIATVALRNITLHFLTWHFLAIIRQYPTGIRTQDLWFTQKLLFCVHTQ